MHILLFILKYVLIMFVEQFIMANGNLARVLTHTDVTKYLTFKDVEGSYVFNRGKVTTNLLLSLYYLNLCALLFL